MAGDTEGEGDSGVYDGVYGGGDVSREDLGFGELLVGEVGGEPVGWRVGGSER